MMKRAALLWSLREILEADRGESIDSLDESVSLKEGLGLDSVDLVTLVMQVQDRYRVVLGTEELERIVTVKDLVDLLQVKMSPISRAA
jgi:acyl carrier protein